MTNIVILTRASPGRSLVFDNRGPRISGLEGLTNFRLLIPDLMLPSTFHFKISRRRNNRDHFDFLRGSVFIRASHPIYCFVCVSLLK